MSNDSSKTVSHQEKRPTSTVPEWAVPILRVCELVYPFFLMLAGFILILSLALIAVKRQDLPWLLNVIGAFGLFTALGFTSLLIAKYEYAWSAWLGTVLGVGLFYMPLLLAIIAKHVGIPFDNQVIAQLAGTSKNVGAYTVVISVVALMCCYVRHFMHLEEKRRQERFVYTSSTAKNVEKPGLIPRCWQMSRCRPNVRHSCPNYVDHITCWKRRSGCFCDRGLANHLIDSTSRGEAQEALDMQKISSVEKSVNAMRGRMTDKSQRRPWKEQKRLCLNCPLFVEHQEYKYKHFSWLSFPITVGIVAGVFHFFDMGYDFTVKYLDKLMTQSLHLPGAHLANSLADSPFEYLLVSVLSLLLLSYVIGFMDRFFLEWKL